MARAKNGLQVKTVTFCSNAPAGPCPKITRISAIPVFHVSFEPGSVTGAKLYIAGLDDPANAAASADALAAFGPQPVDEQIIPVDEHGTDLLSSSHGEQVQAMVEQWFERYLAAVPDNAPVSGDSPD